jgi:hypothetical protein
LRSSATHIVSRVGANDQNIVPLSIWRELLPQLIDDQCVKLITKDTDSAMRERLALAKTEAALFCPLNAQGYLFGALVLSWQHADKFNENRDIPIAKKYASKITAYLEITTQD